MANASLLTLRIEGMDCGSCGIKIENALNRLPGIDAVRLNFLAQTLTCSLDESRTPRSRVEKEIRALGFTPFPLSSPDTPEDRDTPDSPPGSDQGEGCGHKHEHGHEHEHEHEHGHGHPGGHAHGGCCHGDDCRTEDRKTAGAQKAIPSPAAPAWWSTAKGRQALVSGVLLAAAYGLSLVWPQPWMFAAAALIGVLPVARHALAGIRTGTPFGIETLMVVAVAGAIAIGETEEAAVVVFLFSVGELLEGIAAGRARAGIASLVSLIPQTARRRRGETIETIPADRLAVGDIVLVSPGERVPSDGIVIRGDSDVDEAAITGESTPVTKGAGAPVYAGSINANGSLEIEITRAAADNTISRIVQLVAEAQAAKAPTARAIERFSRWYTPAAMIVALLVVTVPPLVLGAPWTVWIYRGLSVLLISCPCALVISTPAAIASGLTGAARRGLLIKGGQALEMLGQIRTVSFDKTGTLTEGRPRITGLFPVGADGDEVLVKAAAVEQGSSHPLGRAIVAEARSRGLSVPEAEDRAALPGKAVTGRLEGRLISVGSPRHFSPLAGIGTAQDGGADGFATLPDDVARTLESQETAGQTVVLVREDGRLLGLIALRDEPRSDAGEALAALRSLAIRPVMLTGDNARTAAAIARDLAIDARAELMPDGKRAVIADLVAEAPVAMVGDGINDAPALAAASVGIAMSGGTDVALETADVTLMHNRILGVAELIALSRATIGVIRQNIGVTLALKSLVLVTALIGITPLWMAILADTGATVLVTANALRLIRFRWNAMPA